jgi:hypothetical protein
VRQKVKTIQSLVEKSYCLRLIVLSQSAAVGEAEASNAGEQLARNSQPETHQHDERGRGREVAPSRSTEYERTTAHRFDEASDA